MASTGEAVLGVRGTTGQATTADSARPRRSSSWLIWVLVALAVLPKLVFLRVPVLGMDESILLIYPEQLLDGRIPNRDFFTVYGPGNFWLLAGAYSVFGQSLLVERLVGIAYQALIVAGVAVAARRHGQVASLAAGVTSALLLTGPNLLATSWMGGLALSVWSLVLVHRDSDRVVLVAGVLAGLATFWRFEMAVFAVAAVPLLWGRPVRARRYVTGVALGAIPTVSHLLVAGGDAWGNVVVQRMGLNAQREWGLLLPAVAVFAVLLLVAVLLLARRAMVVRDRVSISVALFVVCLMPQALQRVDYPHIVSMSGSVVLPLAVAVLAGRGRLTAVVVSRRWVSLGVGFAVAVFVAEGLTTTPVSTPVSHGGRTVYADPATAVQDARIVQAVTEHVPPGGRVFIGSSDMSVPTVTSIGLYHLLPEYRNDFYYLELPVGVAERAGSPLVADIESADALVLTDPPPGYLALYPHFEAGSEAANRAVADGFCPVEELPGAVIYLAGCG